VIAAWIPIDVQRGGGDALASHKTPSRAITACLHLMGLELHLQQPDLPQPQWLPPWIQEGIGFSQKWCNDAESRMTNLRVDLPPLLGYDY
jgi:hypothetical protein